MLIADDKYNHSAITIKLRAQGNQPNALMLSSTIEYDSSRLIKSMINHTVILECWS